MVGTTAGRVAGLVKPLGVVSAGPALTSSPDAILETFFCGLCPSFRSLEQSFLGHLLVDHRLSLHHSE